MKHGADTESQLRMPSGRRIRLALIVVGMVAALVGSIIWRRAGDVSLRGADASSPYKNTRPAVKYVGDAACNRCHAAMGRTFRQHPMGRSLAPITEAPVRGDEAGDRVLFEAQGLQYAIENREGHLIHKETRRDASGRAIAHNEAEVRFAVGSGRMGVAYLIERDGFLFQSPIAWYPRERVWDLPPGYHAANEHYDRPIMPSCLYCHANRVEPVPGSINRYRPPILSG
jgi:hypothetical protein